MLLLSARKGELLLLKNAWFLAEVDVVVKDGAEIVLPGIELGSVRLRLLAQALANNKAALSMDLSRKGLNDEGTGSRDFASMQRSIFT